MRAVVIVMSFFSLIECAEVSFQAWRFEESLKGCAGVTAEKSAVIMQDVLLQPPAGLAGRCWDGVVKMTRAELRAFLFGIAAQHRVFIHVEQFIQALIGKEECAVESAESSEEEEVCCICQSKKCFRGTTDVIPLFIPNSCSQAHPVHWGCLRYRYFTTLDEKERTSCPCCKVSLKPGLIRCFEVSKDAKRLQTRREKLLAQARARDEREGCRLAARLARQWGVGRMQGTLLAAVERARGEALLPDDADSVGDRWDADAAPRDGGA